MTFETVTVLSQHVGHIAILRCLSTPYGTSFGWYIQTPLGPKVYQGLLRSKTTLALRLFTTRALMLFLVVTPLKSSIHHDPLRCQELGCVTFATFAGLDTTCSVV